MKKYNRLQLRRLKRETLLQKKEEHRKFKKVLKKTLLRIAQTTIGLELESNEATNNNVRGEISYFDM